MKRLVRCIIVLLFPLTALSQKEYFIYLQSENEQPFFVRLEDKTFSSSRGGYLIVSKLRDTSHALVVGFPQNKWPDQRFTVAIKAKDHGYLLKNFGEKGWGLFDLQTMSVQMASGNEAALKRPTESTTVSLFTEILSKAANDPSLREKPVFAAVREQKIENTQPANATLQSMAASELPKETGIEVADTPAKKQDLVTNQETKKEDQIPAVKRVADSVQVKPLVTIAVVSNIRREDPVIVQQDPKKEDIIPTIAKVKDNVQTNPADTVSSIAAIPVKKEDAYVVHDEAKPQTQATTSAKTPDTTKAQSVESALDSDEKLKSTGVVIPEEPKKEKTAIASEPGSNITTNRSSSSDYERSEVIKKSESSTTDGFGLTFIDKIADFRQDTIQIFIPNPKTIGGNADKRTADDKMFLDIREGDGQAPDQNAKINCPSVATENDFFKLRKKMAGEKEDESMINEAKKEFRSKCFSVDQIRNLGNLFLNEAGKFQFYEAAYSNSVDKAGFSVLQTEFKDPYFVHRFKNLVN